MWLLGRNLHDTVLTSALSYRSANHWMGSCQMGLDSGLQNGSAVVDTNTKVYGTDNLYVVDASIFPGMVSTNPSALIVAVAERAAELILADETDVGTSSSASASSASTSAAPESSSSDPSVAPTSVGPGSEPLSSHVSTTAEVTNSAGSQTSSSTSLVGASQSAAPSSGTTVAQVRSCLGNCLNRLAQR